MRKWFTKDWWKYLLEKPKCGWSLTWVLKTLDCRIKGHPNGPVWHSSGLEPDMSCRDCGDEL